MSINDDNPFAQMVLPPRTTLPKKVTQEAKKKGDIRRRIEYSKARTEFEKEWGPLSEEEMSQLI